MKLPKFKKYLWSCLLSILFCLTKPGSLEPFSTFASIGAAIGLSALYAGWEYTKCSLQECCHPPESKPSFGNEPWIRYELANLNFDLDKYLHGQHLVKKLIYKVLRAHLRNDNPQKALVLSFHGWTGGGKNYVTNIIARNLFTKFNKTSKSDFVHQVISTHFFDAPKDMEAKKAELKRIIFKGVRKCPRSLFVFDEIDKMPTGLIDAIKPYIDSYNEVDGQDYRKAIFIFLR